MRRLLGVLLLALVTLSCSVNILKEFGDETADQAILYEAKKALNDANYTAAIAYFESMSADFRAQREVAILYASAYAGRCGLDFLNFISDMEGYTDPMMSFLLSIYPTGTSAQFDDCVTAQDIIRAIGEADARTNDENTFMAVVNLVVMGKLLGAEADTDDDGAADGGWDACTVADDDARNFGAALTNLVASLTALGNASVIDSSSIANISTACTALDPLCDTTDPDDFSANEIKLIKGAMFETNDNIGVATCAGDTATCAAGCP